MTGIYKITNLINGNFYIGKSNNIKRRFSEHKILNHETNPSLKLAFKKYGYENFKFEILEQCSVEELNEKEIHYIKTLKPIYNRTNGGDGASGHNVSDEIKELLKRKGRKQWENLSDEEKQLRIKNNLKGPQKGHEVSKETREKLRQANLGKKQSEETKNKMKEAKKNSTYKRTNENHKKPIVCLETGEIFDSIKSAMTKYNLTTLCGHLKGRYKHSGGYHFEYCSVETNRDEFSGVE